MRFVSASLKPPNLIFYQNTAYTSVVEPSMPYASEAQRRFFHTDTAKKKGITSEMVREFDQASRGKKFPEKSAAFMYGVKLADLMSGGFSDPNASMGGTGGAPKPSNAQPNALGTTKPKADKKTGLKPMAAPIDTRGTFLDNVSNAAYNSVENNFNKGEALTMPVLQ